MMAPRDAELNAGQQNAGMQYRAAQTVSFKSLQHVQPN